MFYSPYILILQLVPWYPPIPHIRRGLLSYLAGLIKNFASGSECSEVARAQTVLSYLAVRLARMKTTDVVAFLNVSQSAIATYVLKGEKLVNEDNRIKNQILTSSKS